MTMKKYEALFMDFVKYMDYMKGKKLKINKFINWLNKHLAEKLKIL